MKAIVRSSALILVPAALIALIMAAVETPSKPVEGHAPVVLWSLFLTIVTAVSFCVAIAGRLIELKRPFIGKVGVALRALCYGPLTFSAFMIGFIGFAYVLDEVYGIVTIVLSIAGLFFSGYWLVYDRVVKRCAC